MSKPSFKALQRAIARGDGRSIEDRWAYGRALLDDPRKWAASGEQLRAGAIESLIADAKAVGSKLTETEIRRRLRCARAYPSVDAIRSVATEYATWWDLVQAGFPAVEVDDQADAIEEIGLAEEGNQQDPLFEIPGFKPVLKIRGRKRDLAELTVREAVEYRNMCREMHDSFGRTVTQIDSTVAAMLAGAGGDLDLNALDAYRRATETED